MMNKRLVQRHSFAKKKRYGFHTSSNDWILFMRIFDGKVMISKRSRMICRYSERRRSKNFNAGKLEWGFSSSTNSIMTQAKHSPRSSAMVDSTDSHFVLHRIFHVVSKLPASAYESDNPEYAIEWPLLLVPLCFY